MDIKSVLDPSTGRLVSDVRPRRTRTAPRIRRVGITAKPSTQATRTKNESAIIAGVRQTSVYVRRFKELLAGYLSDIPNATTAERSILRRAIILEIELEHLETKFASDGEASKTELDLYGRTAGNLRRLLESVGLERRAKPVKDIDTYLAEKAREKALQASVDIVKVTP